MGTGILVCGLNGAGKSTLAKMLAEALGFYFIDAEDLYFSRTGPNASYGRPRSRSQALALLRDTVAAHENFVLACVKDPSSEKAPPLYRYIVFVSAPKSLRLQRIEARSLQKFGARAMAGGDLYAQEKAFFSMSASREDSEAEEWAGSLSSPVLRIDGTRPVEENAGRITAWIQGHSEAERFSSDLERALLSPGGTPAVKEFALNPENLL